MGCPNGTNTTPPPCRLRSIAMHDYQERVTTGQTDGQADAGQSDPYVTLCFAGNTTK